MSDVTEQLGMPWWTAAVVYQVYPRSFADSDGDGIGDLRGVIDHLGHLERLGVDVVWLSPVYRSPQDDNGYDIADYEDVDPMFGTLADLDELIAAVHARGMKLVMDLVVNHTSDEHPWFVASRSGPEDPKRDWYWWRPARPGHEPGTPGAEPTSWASFFSGPAWEYDRASGEYYLHLFSRKQPDLNWENPEVRRAVYAMMRRWVERGVDGFRMDVINLISKQVGPDGSLPEQEAPAGALTPAAPFVMNGPRIHEFLAEMHREVLAGRDLFTVGEAPGASVADARLYTDPERAEVGMVFTFEHVDLDIAPGGIKWDLAPLRLVDLKANLTTWQEGLAEAGWNSLYWDNHDQPRIVSRWGDDGEHRVLSAKAWATVLHLLRGTPYVYQGQELGMTNAHFTTLAQYQDVESLRWAHHALADGVPEDRVLTALATKSRDNARTPMQWDSSSQAGFTTGTPWLAVNPNHREINAEAAWADRGSVLHHYRRLIELRHTRPVVVGGDYRLLLADHPQVFAYRRTLGDEVLTVLANLSGGQVRLAAGPDSPGRTSEGLGPIDGEVLVAAGEHRLEAGVLVLGPWASLAVLRG